MQPHARKRTHDDLRQEIERSCICVNVAGLFGHPRIGKKMKFMGVNCAARVKNQYEECRHTLAAAFPLCIMRGAGQADGRVTRALCKPDR